MKANYNVNVYWEAVPSSDNYNRLPDSEKQTVNGLLLAELHALVPASEQLRWRNIPLSNVDYDGVFTRISEKLSLEFVPPQGTQLAFSSVAAAFWVPSPTGHKIVFFARLADASGANERPWEFTVQHKGASFPARMSLRYECPLA